MIWNISEILNQEGNHALREIPCELSELSNGFESFPVKNAGPMTVSLTNDGKGVVILTFSFQCVVSIPCDRCLEPVNSSIVIEMEQKLYGPDRLAENADAEDDQRFLEEYDLDVDRLLQEQVMIHWPDKVLCREDCKGICPVCGKQKNMGPCDCDDFVPDPRWAGLADLLKG